MNNCIYCNSKVKRGLNKEKDGYYYLVFVCTNNKCNEIYHFAETLKEIQKYD